ncbi:MAG: nuclear transport factor 2 family protein [Novosphingobium sp.]|nr:nuclear transport factor 2 family protein [Novosphingobium sp.]
MNLKVSQVVAELADREAIRDCIYRYARGVDRCDEEELRSVYWEDAVDDHCLFKGAREELIAWVMPLLRAREATSHNIDNIVIRLNGDSADAESYFQGYHVVRGESGVTGHLQGGRYLDRFEKRNDEWRIAMRKVVVDWFRTCPDAGDWAVGPQGQSQIEPGGRFPDDDSYRLIDLK